MTNVTKPTATFTPFSGRGEIYLFGPPHNWSIKTLDPETLARIGAIADSLGVAALYAPRPEKCNATICHPNDLTEVVKLPGSQASLHRGTYADGVILPTNCAFWLSSADCQVVVVSHDVSGATVAMHAGRDSLFDRKLIETGVASREFNSVIDAAINRIGTSEERLIKPSQLQAFITGGIGPEEFDHPYGHPAYGEANRRMVEKVIRDFGRDSVLGDPENGRLILSEIARVQMRTHGIPAYRIGFDGIDTFMDASFNARVMPPQYASDMPERCMEGAWWSNRRDSAQGGERNGMLYIRRR